MSKKNEENQECPLCMEAFEMDDVNFFPCTCGYQICRFCWHRIRTNENSLCPACRKQYSEDPANFKPLTAEELQKIKDEKKLKDQLRKQKISEKKKHLGNLRVVQKNLVFVVGLPARLAEIEELHKPIYFGKFGKITKVIVNQCTSYAGSQGPSASAYITYHKSDDALRAIQAVNNTKIDGRTLKASLGTTKYCSNFLRKLKCPKVDCMYLHDIGDESGSFTKEEMQAGRHQEYEQRLHEQLLSSMQNKKPPSPICQLDSPVSSQKDVLTVKNDESPISSLSDSSNSESVLSTVNSPLCDVDELAFSESPCNVMNNEMCFLSNMPNSDTTDSFSNTQDLPQSAVTSARLTSGDKVTTTTVEPSKSVITQSTQNSTMSGPINVWQQSDLQNHVPSSQPSNHSKMLFMSQNCAAGNVDMVERNSTGRIFHDSQQASLLSSRSSPTLYPLFPTNCVSPVKKSLSSHGECFEGNPQQSKLPQALSSNSSELPDFLSVNQAKIGSVNSAFTQRSSSGMPVKYPGAFSLNDITSGFFSGSGQNNTTSIFGQNSLNNHGMNSLQSFGQKSMGNLGQKTLNNHGQSSLSGHRPNSLSNLGQNFMSSHSQNALANHRQNSASIHGHSLLSSHGQNVLSTHGQNKHLLSSHGQSSLSCLVQNSLSNHGQSSLNNLVQNPMSNHGHNSLSNFVQNSLSNHGQSALSNLVQNSLSNHVQKPLTQNNLSSLVQNSLSNPGQNLVGSHSKSSLAAHGPNLTSQNHSILMSMGQNSTQSQVSSSVMGHSQNAFGQNKKSIPGHPFGMSKNPCQNGLIGLMHNGVHRFGQNSPVNNCEEENDLGFDPFEESAKGLAELLAQEHDEKVKTGCQSKTPSNVFKSPFYNEDSSSLNHPVDLQLYSQQQQQYHTGPPPGFAVNSSGRPVLNTDVFPKKATAVMNSYDQSSTVSCPQDTYVQSNLINFSPIQPIGETSARSQISDWQVGVASMGQRNFDSSHNTSSHNLSQFLGRTSPLPVWSTASDSDASAWLPQEQNPNTSFAESTTINTKLEKILQQLKLEQAAKLQNSLKYNAFSAY